MAPQQSTVATSAITADAIAALVAQMRGPVILPGDPSYDEARAVYNAAIDRRPAVITQCLDVADVIAAVNFGREQRLPIAIRGGGHNGPGLGTVEGGLVIDLGLMRGVRIDPDARTARVEGGARLGDLHHAAHAFGLATPSGIIASTGVGGITLGGGLGHLTRQLGLAIDNLLEA
ncbi:MAG: FAD-binding protein, partial [Thermomicrobiales bacterium]|nr:FAD-binding protein [Thermomicrobiales bacterium]